MLNLYYVIASGITGVAVGIAIMSLIQDFK